jgi:Zn-dependent protease with chaperone function
MATTERESFYDAQRRHRRSGWRFSVLSGAAVLLLGVPLSVIVSPFVAAMGLVTMDVVNLVVPMPDPLEDLRDLGEDLSEADRRAEADGEAVEWGPIVDEHTGDLVLLAVLLIVPGIVAMLVVWLCVRRLFLRAGAGAVALATGAREPRPGDLEERQLVNLVEEMAIAAGVPPPRVLVLDAPEPNAAVVGRSKDDATIIVPRGLLDELGRAPTGAIVADMLAVIVNGDLRVALVLASVFQTFDAVGAVLAAPFSKPTRRVLWRTLRLALRRPSRRGDGTDEARLAAELTRVGAAGGLGDDDDIGSGCLRTAVQFPFFVASISFVLTRLLVGGFFVSPTMAALWRRRRLLADATAVELTRDPDALARALDHLRTHGARVPPGPWTHLFAIGPEVGRERAQRRMEQRRDEIWWSERPAGESRLGSFTRRSRAALAASSDYRPDLAAEEAGGVTADVSVGGDLATFLPPLGKRLARLEAMGAAVAADRDRPPRRRAGLLLTAIGWVVGLVLLAVMLVLFVCLFGCLAAFVYLAIMFELALVAPLVLLSHSLLR